MVGLVVIFFLFDEWQRLRRRIKNLEERVTQLESEGGEGATWVEH